MINTFWSLVPAIISISLALITKEVYSSLFIGIVIGGFFYSGLSFTGFLSHIFTDGFVGQLSNPSNIGILMFLVLLGTIVTLMNKAGGSAAFGNWAKKHIKTKTGAQIATVFLGLMIFIDDYFNCLTVGSVMSPVTKKYGISKEKLAYLIDSTAAPICIIAPISSWAAAVSGFVSEGENGIALFCKAIPFNFYALFTIIMIFLMIYLQFEYGEMSKFEKAKSILNDKENSKKQPSSKGTVFDLIFPIVILICLCTLSLIYSGGFFSKGSENFLNFINSFANCDSSFGLMIGSFGAIIIIIFSLLFRKILTFKECMNSFIDGFAAMIPAILILTMAWTLKSITDSLGAGTYVANIVNKSASGLQMFLPAIIFLIGCFLSFATGTSWGTFGILIPICISVFTPDNPLRIISISACMAGAVCGDHCSPISDSTIMASAGAECDHLKHVSTQLPYSISVAIVSFVTYIVAGLTSSFGTILSCLISLAVGLTMLVSFLFAMKYRNGIKQTKKTQI